MHAEFSLSGRLAVLLEKIQANVEACLSLPPQVAKKAGAGSDHEVCLYSPAAMHANTK